VTTPAVLAWRPQGMPAVLEAFVASVQNLVEGSHDSEWSPLTPESALHGLLAVTVAPPVPHPN
jgi:hypothetical protein